MYEVFTQAHFSAAHHLVSYEGDCARWHGHNWVVRVHIQSEDLDDRGISIDLREVKRALREELAELDHRDLNRLPAFRERNPTCEVIAEYLFHRIGRRLNGDGRRVSRLEVRETPDSGAIYSE